MCGIFGYIGPKDPAKTCLEGLKFLEYRGYDSAGIAGLKEGVLLCTKESGKIATLEAILQKQPLHLELAIAHTRWATHGEPTQVNAHPHYGGDNEVVVVHNGIVENFQQLREMLMQKGVRFASDTDSEVIAQLIAFYYKGEILPAVQKALSLMRGFWALAIIHKDHPDTIVAAAKESPLCIGIDRARSETFVSSDANAFHGQDLDVLFLKNNEAALITSEKVEVFDSASMPVDKPLERLRLAAQTISKGPFDHFMLKEIYEQPQAIQQALHNRFIESLGTVEFESLQFTPKELLAVKRILILGCGTSWHAGCIAASLIEEKARIPCQAEIASEFRYKTPIIPEETLVIAISQSGETLDTLAAVREVKSKGAKVLGICNVTHSSLAREVDSCLFLRAGPEISVCSTKAFTSQLTVLSLFTLLMARLRHLSKEEGQLMLQEIRSMPQVVQQVLDRRDAIRTVAHKYASYSKFFFLGRHYMFSTALEGALKLKEISYSWAMGYPAGEMKHGPIALVGPELAVVGMCGNQRTYEKTISNLIESKARGAPVIAFVPDQAPQIASIADDIIYLPSVSDELASIPYSVAAQLFAYEVALHLDREIDKPRNLAKSVTVE